MTSADLMALTRRLLDQLEVAYIVSEDGAEVAIDTEDGQPLFISTLEVGDGDDDSLPVLFLYSSVVEDVNRDSLDQVALGYLNNDLIVGKLALADVGDGVNLLIQQECVGWPGARELRMTWERMLGQAFDLREQLLEVTGGSRPASFDDLGS